MDFQAARKHMVESQVRPHDVTDLRIQAALLKAPRELFLPAGLRDRAYIDAEIPYAPGRWLIPARDFAKLLTAARPKPTDLTLDVGCGSGYSTAVLAGLTEMVVAVEDNEELAAAATQTWEKLDIANAAVVNAPPAEGAPGQGPFDVIFIGAAIEKEPTALLEQLKDGGRLVAIRIHGRRNGGVPQGVVYARSDGATSERIVFNASSRKVMPGFEEEKKFVF